MVLENSLGKRITNPDMDIIAEQITLIENEKLNYIILSKDDNSYLQTYKNDKGELVLEYKSELESEIMKSAKAFNLKQTLRFFERYIGRTESLAYNVDWVTEKSIKDDERDDEYGLVSDLNMAGNTLLIGGWISMIIAQISNFSLKNVDLIGLDGFDIFLMMLNFVCILKYAYVVDVTQDPPYYMTRHEKGINLTVLISMPLLSMYHIYKFLF